MDAWQRLDNASETDAAAWLMTSCGSTHWCDRMVARRPFRDQDTLQQIAREEWFGLSPRDWKEAFKHHPRLGDRDDLRARFPTTGALAEQEQAGLTAASADELDALAADNRTYEGKFGYVFIACAAGQSAASVLAMLRERLNNDAGRELMVAAEEQAKITALRLEGLGA